MKPPRLKSLLFTLALAFVFAGCEKTAPPPEAKVLFQAIEDNVRSFDTKDVNKVMATIHPQAPNFEQSRDIISDMFSKVELKFTVSDLKVVTASPEEARVSFVQKTEKVEGDHRVPLNIIEGIDTLRPDNGKWKIYRTDNVKVTRLDVPADEAPKPAPPAPESASPPPATEPVPKPAEPADKPTPPAATPPPPAGKPAQ